MTEESNRGKNQNWVEIYFRVSIIFCFDPALVKTNLRGFQSYRKGHLN